MSDQRKAKVYDPKQIGFTSFKLTGFEAIVKCPFHNDQHPSAAFNMSSGLFICFSCGHRCNASQLAERLGGEAVKTEQGIYRPKIAASAFDEILHHMPLALNNSYLVGRGVTNESVEEFDLRLSGDNIAIPFYDPFNLLMGIQLRSTLDNPKIRYFNLGDKPIVWPINHVSQFKIGGEVVLTEGVFGAINARQHGFQSLATLGVATVTNSIKYLEKFNVYLAFDQDLPGYIATTHGLQAGLMFTHSSTNPVVADEATAEQWANFFNGSRKKTPVGFIRELPEEYYQVVLSDFVGFINRKHKRKL